MMFGNESRGCRLRVATSCRRRSYGLEAIALALFVAGCSQTGLTRQSSLLFGGRSTVEFSMSSDLNQRAPLAFDLLVVYDDTLLETLETVDAATWFHERDQILKDFGRQLEAHRWEWVPGQPPTRAVLRFRRGVRGAVAFADYQSAGDHRLAFNPSRDLLVTLGEDSWTLDQ